MTAMDDAVFSGTTGPIGATGTGGGGTLADIVFIGTRPPFFTGPTYAGGALIAVSFDGPHITTNCPAGAGIFPVFDGSDAIEGPGGDT